MGFLDKGGRGDVSRLNAEIARVAAIGEGYRRSGDLDAAVVLARELESETPGRAAREHATLTDAKMGRLGQRVDSDPTRAARESRESVAMAVWGRVKNEAAATARSAHLDRPFVRAARKLPSGVTARLRGEYEISALSPADRTTVALALTGLDRFTADVEPHLKSLAIAERDVDAKEAAIMAERRGASPSPAQISRLTELRRSLAPHRERAQAALEGAVASDAGGDDWKPLAGPLANDGHGDGLLPQSDGRVLVDDGAPQAM